MSPREVIPSEPAIEELLNAITVLQTTEQAGELAGSSPAVVESWHAVAARIKAAIAKLQANDATSCPCSLGMPELCERHNAGRL